MMGELKSSLWAFRGLSDEEPEEEFLDNPEETGGWEEEEEEEIGKGGEGEEEGL
jgi:hypothetical protein